MLPQSPGGSTVEGVSCVPSSTARRWYTGGSIRERNTRWSRAQDCGTEAENTGNSKLFGLSGFLMASGGSLVRDA